MKEAPISDYFFKRYPETLNNFEKQSIYSVRGAISSRLAAIYAANRSCTRWNKAGGKGP